MRSILIDDGCLSLCVMPEKRGDYCLDISIEQMREKQPQIQEMLVNALQTAFLNPCVETIAKVIRMLSRAYVYNLSALIPVKTIDNDLKYMMLTVKGQGNAYIACTSDDECKKYNNEIIYKNK